MTLAVVPLEGVPAAAVPEADTLEGKRKASAGRVSDPWGKGLAAAILGHADSEHSVRAYELDLRTFRGWLQEVGLAWDAATLADLEAYRGWLQGKRWARATVNRRLGTVRGLYAEACARDLIARDPALRLRGLRGRDDRDGGALTLGEARALLDSIAADRERPGRELLARRDLALVGLLLRTGVRRSEATALRVGDLGTAQGHAVAVIRHGKGNVSRTVKLPPDLRRILGEWLEASGLAEDPAAPLFVEVGRWGRIAPQRRPLGDRSVLTVVRRRLEAAGLPVVSPHGLRRSYVTLAIEAGAPLPLVQVAAGHADPRTTMGYWRRKANLDHHASDYLRGLDL